MDRQDIVWNTITNKLEVYVLTSQRRNDSALEYYTEGVIGSLPGKGKLYLVTLIH